MPLRLHVTWIRRGHRARRCCTLVSHHLSPPPRTETGTEGHTSWRREMDVAHRRRERARIGVLPVCTLASPGLWHNAAEKQKDPGACRRPGACGLTATALLLGTAPPGRALPTTVTSHWALPLKAPGRPRCRPPPARGPLGHSQATSSTLHTGQSLCLNGAWSSRVSWLDSRFRVQRRRTGQTLGLRQRHSHGTGFGEVPRGGAGAVPGTLTGPSFRRVSMISSRVSWALGPLNAPSEPKQEPPPSPSAGTPVAQVPLGTEGGHVHVSRLRWSQSAACAPRWELSLLPSPPEGGPARGRPWRQPGLWHPRPLPDLSMLRRSWLDRVHGCWSQEPKATGPAHSPWRPASAEPHAGASVLSCGSQV